MGTDAAVFESCTVAGDVRPNHFEDVVLSFLGRAFDMVDFLVRVGEHFGGRFITSSFVRRIMIPWDRTAKSPRLLAPSVTQPYSPL